VVPRPPVRRVAIPEAVGEKPSRPYVVNGVRYYPLPDEHGFVQTGKASWYGGKFHGRTTSSGEIYDMHAMTAAHKTLPLGTVVHVENLVNGKSTVVRINDRGPFVKGRIIDLSYGAAKEIGLVGPGVSEVRVTALGRQVGAVESRGKLIPVVETQDLRGGEFAVQVGAFLEKRNATELARRLEVLFEHVTVTKYIDEQSRILHRVRVSKAGTLEEAERLEQKLKEIGFEGAFIVKI
jgi:rare lipoprotein A